MLDIQNLVHSFVTLFVTADPISIVPLFIVMAGGLDVTAQRQIAFRAVIIAGAVLIAFALLGNEIIAFFGITIQAFEVGGGLLLFAIAFRMVFSTGSESQATSAGADSSSLTQIAVFPLAIPMIAGPGAISATILLTSHRNGWVDLVGLVADIVVLMGLTYIVLRLSNRINRALGEIGRVVASRLLGVILAALAMQFIGHGVLTFAGMVLKTAP